MIAVLAELFGHYRLGTESTVQEISIADQKLVLEGSSSSLLYRRLAGTEVQTQTTIMSDKGQVIVGVFPIPPIFTPQQIASNLYLKFRYPIVVDQQSQVVVYAKMPIEIGVYRQSEDEELLMDAFSPAQQQYALYGSPESGVVCRYYVTECGASKEDIKLEKFREALVRVRISNDIDNIIKVSRVVIPLLDVVLDHAHDDAWLPGSVEMSVDSAFGRDVVNVRYVDARIKRHDKTSKSKREETRTFLMDAGY